MLSAGQMPLDLLRIWADAYSPVKGCNVASVFEQCSFTYFSELNAGIPFNTLLTIHRPDLSIMTPKQWSNCGQGARAQEAVKAATAIQQVQRKDMQVYCRNAHIKCCSLCNERLFL